MTGPTHPRTRDNGPITDLSTGLLVALGGVGEPNGYDDPALPIRVPAGELLDWARLAGQLAEWLVNAADTTRHDHAHRCPHGPDLPATAWTLEQISERIGALLNGDRGRP